MFEVCKMDATFRLQNDSLIVHGDTEVQLVFIKHANNRLFFF